MGLTSAPFVSWILAGPAVPDFQSFVLLIAQYAGPAILAYFLFYQERKVHQDYITYMKASPAVVQHHKRMHTATVVVTYSLIAVCVGVWLANLFGKASYIEGQFFGLTEQSMPKVTEQVQAQLPDNAEFFTRKRGPDGGATSFTVSWILVGDSGLDKLPFVFQHQYSVPPPAAPNIGDSPLLRDESAGANPPAPVTQAITKTFSISIKGLKMSSSRGPTIQYKAATDPSKVGAFYLQGDTNPIPWDDDQAAGVKAVRSWKDAFHLAVVHAQTGADCSKVLAAGTELMNQLGNSDLTTQLSAQRALTSCGSCCVPLLEQATKDMSSALNRDRSILMASLGAVIQQDEKNNVKLSDTVYANFGRGTCLAAQYKEALTALNKVSGPYLDSNPSFYFYRGFARSQTGDSAGAIQDYNAYLQKAPAGADRGTPYNNLGMIYYRLGNAAEAASHKPEAASNFQQAINYFKQASQDGYSVPKQFSDAAATGLKRVQ